MTLPANTFGASDLLLAREALLIVDGLVSRAIGDAVGPSAVERLHDLAARLRRDESAGAEPPGIACEWPWTRTDGGGEMAFHVAAGGTEYDGVTLSWTIGEGERLSRVYAYDGRDELYVETTEVDAR